MDVDDDDDDGGGDEDDDDEDVNDNRVIAARQYIDNSLCCDGKCRPPFLACTLVAEVFGLSSVSAL